MEDQKKNINKMVKISNVSNIKKSILKSFKNEQRNEIIDNIINDKGKKAILNYKLLKPNKNINVTNDAYNYKNVKIISKNNLVRTNYYNFILCKNIVYFLIFFIIFNNLFISIKSQNNDNRKLAGGTPTTILEITSNYITLIISGTGLQKVLNSNKNYYKVYVNGIETEFAEEYRIFLDENINNVTIEFQEEFTDFNEIFRELNNIIEIDLSNFDYSNIKSMNYMFSDCVNLEKVTFNNNINPRMIMDLECMFYGCKSLKSIDLSSFDTEQVTNMKRMFYDCSSLESLDLYNFNTDMVDNMEEMFKGCTFLKYVNISNFRTTDTTYMSNLFYGCTNLEYINLTYFEGDNTTNSNNILKEVPINVMYCMNSDDNILGILLEEKRCSMNNCFENWKDLRQKQIPELDKCVNNCSEDETYQYLYNNRCYKDCPTGTHKTIINNEKLCLIDCQISIPFLYNDECFNTCNPLEFLNKECMISNENIDAKQSMINEISNWIYNDTTINLFLNK